MIDDLIHHSRGVAVLGEVVSIDDTGEAQTITVQTHDGIVRSGVEVASVHGPVAFTDAVVFQLGVTF